MNNKSKNNFIFNVFTNFVATFLGFIIAITIIDYSHICIKTDNIKEYSHTDQENSLYDLYEQLSIIHNQYKNLDDMSNEVENKYKKIKEKILLLEIEIYIKDHIEVE